MTRTARFKTRLLAGASGVAFAAALAAGPAHAQLGTLHGAAHVAGGSAGAPRVAVPVIPGLATDGPSMASAAQRTLQNANRAQQAVSLALQAQAAARQAAAALPSSVPNGLAVGGLQMMAHPVLAAADLTGLNTWQGANLPTQTVAANGAVNVEIQQTASRAVLDWTTFNVGVNTTLNFNQSQNGVAQPTWVALNRVVGQLDPVTGLRNPDLAPAPSQILGAIKSQGTVLVINQNGILFGPTAQVNTNALIASSLEIGSQIAATATAPATLAGRDSIFLTQSLLVPSATTFSGQVVQQVDAQGNVSQVADPLLEGAVTVQAGAQIASGQGGFILLAAPNVSNAGALSSSQGQVSLVSGRVLTLTPSSGTSGAGGDPNLRGLALSSFNAVAGIPLTFNADTVTNTGLIQSPEGYASLTGTSAATIVNAGVITASTSVARNGFVQLGGANVQLAPGSIIAITPDDTATIPQDPNSLADFKSSQVSIGDVSATGGFADGASIDVASGSLIYAPNANVYVGSAPGLGSISATPTARVFVDSGATIDASGLKDVQIAASTNEVTISPVTANDTADTPAQRNTLNHLTVTVDPRLSGVRADGVTWVGSPLIPAQAFAQQVGVTASQLMTKGGNVVLGAAGTGAPGTLAASDVIVKAGAVIDVSGGWTTFAAGRVQTTELVAADGSLVDIGSASPDEVYLGVYNGFTAVEPRFGIATIYANPLLSGARFEAAYTQGADAGSLTVKSSQPSLEGAIYAQTYTGPLQAQTAQLGTAAPTLYGDQRHLQAVGAQLPAGGFLFVQETGTGGLLGGDIEIGSAAQADTTAALTFGSAAPAGRTADSFVAPAEQATLTLSAPALTAMGLGQLSLYTSGALTVDASAGLTLAPGGVFTATTGRAITIAGAVTAPSGLISLTTVHSDTGSAINPTSQAVGDYDVTVNGQLSAAGLWRNDYLAAPGAPVLGPGYINGGTISIAVAAREDAAGPTVTAGQGDVATAQTTLAGTQPSAAADVSGSIRVAGAQSLLDVSAGGYVAPSGALTLTGRGGNVTLTDDTAYFPFELFVSNGVSIFQGAGFTPGFRVNGFVNGIAASGLPINPAAITSQVTLAEGAVRGYGFGGGGTFSLTTPALAFGGGVGASGTDLPLDFFSNAGFATYALTSYATALIPNAFTNGFGGYNAVLATQVLTVAAGQTLNLTQSGFATHLTGAQTQGLRGLTTGGSVASIVAPGVQPDAFDQRPVALDLGGLIEFKVAPGGVVTGAVGASLSAAQIDNAGVIRLPGGALSQSEILPALYSGRAVLIDGLLTPSPVVAASSLASVFSVNATGGVDENAPSIADSTLTNAQLAVTEGIYLTGDLPAGVGLYLAPGSVTDLAGAAVINPYAPGVTQGRQIVTGFLAVGGAVSTATPTTTASPALFAASMFDSNNPAFIVQAPTGGLVAGNPGGVQSGLALVAAPGATVKLAGATAVFDQLTSSGQYVQSAQWSGGGSLTAGAGFTLTGAIIDAHGGAPQAAGGVLTLQNPILTAADPVVPTANTLSAGQIEAAGFGVLVAQGSLTAGGATPVSLTLPQAFFLIGTPVSEVQLGVSPALTDLENAQALFPTFSGPGTLQISAPYVALQGAFQALGSPVFAADVSTATTGRVTLNAQAIDVTGAVLFDQAIGKASLNATGDIRFIGVTPFQPPGAPAPPSLAGQLAVNGDLTLDAAQVYATTGSSFAVTSAAATGTIVIAAATATPPATPYSAGSNLTIQAANIVQAGTVRAPLGALTIGGGSPLAMGVNNAIFAPATASLQLVTGSLTSVSADGLSIPYGVTTDQLEYFFNPTSSAALSAPPAAALTLAGQSVVAAAGATVDLKGGGDVFAYEFIPGTGGSRDVLSQFNADAFTSNAGYQYADHRQVYAIVPGLSAAAAAAFDPIYSANYTALYAPGGAGSRVSLNAGPGVAAGTYTLLPAQYAVLPGGFEVVEDTGATTVPGGASVTHLDGSVTVTGVFAGLGGSLQSTPHEFDIRSQPVIAAYSDIALTSGSTTFAAQAASAGVTAPRLPADAGRLVISPSVALDLSADFQTTPAMGGRGAEVDVTAGALQIVSALGAPTPGVVQLAADQLTALGASSLLIGGVRTDNPDGTTALAVTAGQLTVANDAGHPLEAADILLAVDGPGAALTLTDGATLIATGADTTGQTGDYLIAGSPVGPMTGQGAFVRVSNGAGRLVTRSGVQPVAPGVLTVGAATLTGASVALDSSGAVALSPTAAIAAGDVTLDAASLAFAPSAAGLSGLVLTPSLQAALGQAKTLTLRSPQPIGFADGAYGFANLNLDTPGLVVASGVGAVTVNAQAVQLRDLAGDAGLCAASGALACGAGTFALDAQSLAFGDGVVRIYGAGSGVSLSAPAGIVYQGQASFDVGAAPLSIQTPFLADAIPADAKIAVALVAPSLSITTMGALSLTDPGAATAAAVAGLPGARLGLSGQSVAITGVDVRATAGTLTVASASGIAVGAGAVLETPGYSHDFGDAADPFVVSAPGGLLTLTAAAGDIGLASGSTLSVGGGAGAAGSLALFAGQGQVAFGGAVIGAAPTGGAGFALNEAGAFDLAGFETATKGAFDGEVAIQTGAGDLALAAGQTLTARDATLTANGGAVTLAGTIDVSGVNGGQVGLFGATGVSLASAALIDAHANGYGAGDTRQASGGQVTLGTAGAGAIDVAAGAAIDVSARQVGARIVEGNASGIVTYDYVAADQGGTLTLRAPVTGPDGAESVAVAFAGGVLGARSVVLEGYRAYDLGAVAAGGAFSGVSVAGAGAGGVATLDTTATGQPNFLADVAPGTLANFIQGFDVSGSYGALGGLASATNFHARPGVELDFAGAITLASNWNLGAGGVDVAGAVAAGLMVADPAIPGAFSVVPGDEAAVFAHYTHLTYRVGGAVLGEPSALTLKAGGQLTLQGSVTDGFFTFGDQSDETFLDRATGGGPQTYNGLVSASCSNCAATPAYSSSASASASAVSVPFPSASGFHPQKVAVGANLIPYDAAANTPGALGTGTTPGYVGDPLGSAALFPLVPTPVGAQVVASSSYRFTGGAAAGANPLAVTAGAAGGVVVQNGPSAASYQYGGASASTLTNTLLFTVGAQSVTADQFVAAEEAATPTLNANSLSRLTFSSAPSGVKTLLQADAKGFFTAHPGQYTFTGPSSAPTGVSTTLALEGQFLQEVAAQWATLKSGYAAPASNAPVHTIALTPRIRTGTGDIALAAAGDIDLRNGATPTYLDAATGAVSDAGSGFQLGGAAIYTAGALTIPSVVTAIDTTTGAAVTLDPSAFATIEDNVGVLPYGYGGGAAGGLTGLAGVLVADAVYASGGGGVSLTAGGAVLGRRDAYTQARLATADNAQATAVEVSGVGGGRDFIGWYDQPWRLGTVGAPGAGTVTNILVNPQLFTEGLGALGGGDVTVRAGGAVSDLTTVADASVATGTATGGVSAGQINQGTLTFGGGNVTLAAGGDILGGRIDVASGAGVVSTGGGVTSAGTLRLSTPTQPPQLLDDTLRLRLADATIAVSAQGDVTLEGIAALGVQRDDIIQTSVTSNSYAANFFSPRAGVSLTAGGALILANAGGGFGGSDVILDPFGGNEAILPGSLTAVALNGDVSLNTDPQLIAVVLEPSPTGTLTVAAGANVTGLNLGLLDSQPGPDPLLPTTPPGTTQAQLQAQHDLRNIHQADAVPNRVYAGGDITGLTLYTPKQTRIGAGRDIVDMVFFGQNLNPGDVTRVVAGRDITATTQLESASSLADQLALVQEPTVQGNLFVLGGPGALMVEAGRNLGPFLTSAAIATLAGEQSFAGGVLTVGPANNPNLSTQGARLTAEFGVGKGQDFAALSSYYLDPTNLANLPDYLFQETLNANNVYVPDKTQPIYQPLLISYMQSQQQQVLQADYSTTSVTYAQAYQAFNALPALQQRAFLLQVYFHELSLTSTPGPTFDQYQRGYTAVNLLFPASLGYTANNLSGGSNGANVRVHTGDLDLRLATIETQYGGDVDILGPGGRVLAGSTVATAQQAARRDSAAPLLYAGDAGDGRGGFSRFQSIDAIPAGFEGVLTLRGGAVSGFTDGDFVLNQSRLFTEQGGDVTLWSSNGDLNAGEGPKTSSDFPPVVVQVDADGFSQLDQATSVTGAGIAAFQPAPGVPAPDVFLIAPRGTVDAGAAGVRVAGNLFVAALHVANADNFQVAGTAIGLPPASTTVSVSTQSTAASSAAVQAAQDAVARAQGPGVERSVISVEVLGFGDPCIDPRHCPSGAAIEK